MSWALSLFLLRMSVAFVKKEHTMSCDLDHLVFQRDHCKMHEGYKMHESKIFKIICMRSTVM